MKGLACLSTLTLYNRLSLAEIARELKLPKTTAFRILDTLCAGGYVVQDEDLYYKTTAKAGNLGPRYDEDRWIRDIVRPALVELGKKVIWPVGISTPLGLSMYVQITTSNKSPFAIGQFRPGMLLPMDKFAAGRMFLAYQSARVQALYVSALRRQNRNLESPVHDLRAFRDGLRRFRSQGYGIDQSTDVESVLCVPVFVKRRIIGVIGMRYISSALSTTEVRSQFLPIVSDAADGMSAEMERRRIDPGSNEIEILD